jgi:hypothetical protein
VLLVLIELSVSSFTSNFAESLKTSGEYGNPPSFTIFSIQLVLWLFIVIVSKTLIIGLLILFETPLNDFVSVIFDHFEGYRHFELLFVMILVPFILNILQFWVQDAFLKKRDPISKSEYSLIHQSTSDQDFLIDGDIPLSVIDRSRSYR